MSEMSCTGGGVFLWCCVASSGQGHFDFSHFDFGFMISTLDSFFFLPKTLAWLLHPHALSIFDPVVERRVFGTLRFAAVVTATLIFCGLVHYFTVL